MMFTTLPHHLHGVDNSDNGDDDKNDEELNHNIADLLIMGKIIYYCKCTLSSIHKINSRVHIHIWTYIT